MPDPTENRLPGHAQLVERLRSQDPAVRFMCGYSDVAPDGYERVYAPNRIRYFQVPDDAVLERHEVSTAGPGGDTGTLLVIREDAQVTMGRAGPAELLEGTIQERLERLIGAVRCYTTRTRTPKHNPHSDFLGEDGLTGD